MRALVEFQPSPGDGRATDRQPRWCVGCIIDLGEEPGSTFLCNEPSHAPLTTLADVSRMGTSPGQRHAPGGGRTHTARFKGRSITATMASTCDYAPRASPTNRLRTAQLTSFHATSHATRPTAHRAFLLNSRPFTQAGWRGEQDEEAASSQSEAPARPREARSWSGSIASRAHGRQ